MKPRILLAVAALWTAQPQIFAPGIVSGVQNPGSPTFTPDGRTIYFTRGDDHSSAIMESHRVGDGWSAPQVAPFSNEGSNQQPALAPDGSFLVWVSVRDHRANLWRVNRQGSSWTAPTRLPDAVNIAPNIWRPSVARDGSIYFFVIAKGRAMRLYQSQYDHGQYAPAMPLSFSDGTKQDVDPEIAPDESFIVFASAGRSTAGDAHERLYVAHRHGAEWGPVAPFQYEGIDPTADDNEPRLSPDGQTLYFTRNTNVLSLGVRKGLIQG